MKHTCSLMVLPISPQLATWPAVRRGRTMRTVPLLMLAPIEAAALKPVPALPAWSLLQFEREGHVRVPGLLRTSDLRELIPYIDNACRAKQLEAHAQKVRVLCGAEAVDQARHDAMVGSNKAMAAARANGRASTASDDRNTRDRGGGGGGGVAAGLDERQQKELLRALQRRLNALPDGAVPFLQHFNLWRVSPEVFSFVSSPQLAGVAAQLLGGDDAPVTKLRLYQDSLFTKRPGDGATNWHSDLAMVPLDTNSFVTLWIPLAPVAAAADGGSPLVFAGKSHRDLALGFWHGDPRKYPDLSDRGYSEPSADAMAVGDVSCHHGWTLHCAPPNHETRQRRALAVSYFVDGALRVADPADGYGEDRESHDAWSTQVAPGQRAAHSLLPVVWPPSAAPPHRAAHSQSQRRGSRGGGASRGGNRGDVGGGGRAASLARARQTPHSGAGWLGGGRGGRTPQRKRS